MSEIKLPEHYIRVPDNIILAKEKEVHRVMVLFYLNYFESWEKTCMLSLKPLTNWCGFDIKWPGHLERPNKYKEISDTVSSLQDLSYIKGFVSPYPSTDAQVVNVIKPETQYYAIIYDSEIEAIKCSDKITKSITPSIVLLVLSYIRLRTLRRKNYLTGHSKKSMKNKPEMLYTRFSVIADELGLTAKKVSSVIDLLVELGIIALRKTPNYKNEKSYWQTGYNIIVFKYRVIYLKGELIFDENYDWKTEMENGEVFITSGAFKNKKFYQEFGGISNEQKY